MTKLRRRKNGNHPPKHSVLSIQPIKNLNHIKQIKNLLQDKPRDLLLFTMGINCPFRMGDLLKLKVGQVRRMKVGDELIVREEKTKKKNILVMNGTTHKTLKNYLEKLDVKDDDFLFFSQRPNKSGDCVLTVPAVNLKVKTWGQKVGVEENLGCHSLRKTFGYIHRTEFDTPIEVLMKIFNHSSQSITLRYLGIGDEEINGTLLHEI
jgi:integrase